MLSMIFIPFFKIPNILKALVKIIKKKSFLTKYFEEN
jgi:hypothetical protein